MLYEFVATHREEIIRRCGINVATRSAPSSTQAELNYGVPLFLDQLIETLRLGQLSSPEIAKSAGLHGLDLQRHGFTVSQVVHDYGDVCQSITELAIETNAPITARDFRTLNQCLDDAIANAVTEYVRDCKAPGGADAARASDRLGSMAHELRNLINTSMIAFQVLRTGSVGVAGSTGTVLGQSLQGLDTLIDRSLTEARLEQGVQNREQVLMSGFIEELTPAAALEANALGVKLAVMPVADGIVVEADRPILAAVVGNLLQNAFKFTHAGTTVTLGVSATAERVLIEIEDACGGLSADTVNDLSRLFEQRSANGAVLGLGLAFSRWAAEGHKGRISARSLPGKGCVFTVDLPRFPVPVVAIA